MWEEKIVLDPTARDKDVPGGARVEYERIELRVRLADRRTSP
jgi:hypothetical protein